MRRICLIALAALAVAVVSGLARPPAAVACSCAAQPDRALLRQADAVFAGTVVARRETQPTTGVAFSGAPVVWTFAVDAVVKGTVAPDQRVVSAGESASCAYGFAVGSRYLVLANPATGELLAADPGAVSTGLCSGTRPLSPGAPLPDLAMLPPPRRYPVFWLGEAFEGLGLHSVTEPRGRVTYTYRGCAKDGCGVVLRIRTVRTCRSPAAYLVPLTDPERLRGVPSGRRNAALVLFTGRQQVRIIGPPALARRAAVALRAANRAIGVGADLPPPVRWAVDEGLACPVAAQQEAPVTTCSLGSPR